VLLDCAAAREGVKPTQVPGRDVLCIEVELARPSPQLVKSAY
jgi:hypothetical protein